MTGAEFELHLSRSDFTLNASGRIDPGSITALYGPSGCGKTTLLRCLAGLEKAKGHIQVDGQIWQSPNHRLPVHKRAIGYVFQEASLLPHLSVGANLNYARQRARSPLANKDIRALAHAFDIERLMSNRATALSGGERQRVALVRALLIKPLLLLLDEPMTALDQTRREQILPYLQQLPSWSQAPIIYVSHSLDEVTRLASQVIIMQQGQTQPQQAITQAFDHHQQTPEMGEALSTVVQGQLAEHRDGLMKVDIGPTQLWMQPSAEHHSKTIRVRLLASDISVSLQPLHGSSVLNQWPVQIEQIVPDVGGQVRLSLRLLSTQQQPSELVVLALISRRSQRLLQLQPGQALWAQMKASAIRRR